MIQKHLIQIRNLDYSVFKEWVYVPANEYWSVLDLQNDYKPMAFTDYQEGYSKFKELVLDLIEVVELIKNMFPGDTEHVEFRLVKALKSKDPMEKAWINREVLDQRTVVI